MHQGDPANDAKHLRGAADVLEVRGEARGEEEERRAQHMLCVKN